MGVILLRSGPMGDSRFYTIEAAKLSSSEFYEAWIACGHLSRPNAGSTSDAVKTARSIEELEEWARALEEDEVRALVNPICPP